MEAGDRVFVSNTDHEWYDDGSDPPLGSTGTVIRVDRSVLVVWDETPRDGWSANPWSGGVMWARDIGIPDMLVSSRNFWWVHRGTIELCQDQSIQKTKSFRDRLEGETLTQYNVCKKIYQMDLNWKEKQNAKTVHLSV